MRNSILFRFLLVFLLFGSLLVMITVSIQNDFAGTATEKLTAAQEEQTFITLRSNIGPGEWNVTDHWLYKGDVPVGNGLLGNANTEAFLRTERETESFVYSFLHTSYADAEVLQKCAAEGREATDFLRVAGSTLDAEGNPIVGTFLDRDICEALEKNGEYIGRSFVEGRSFYCYYNVLRDAAGNCIGAIVAGRSSEEMDRKARQSALNSSLTVGVIILYTFVSLFLFVYQWNRSLKRMESHLKAIGKGEFPAQDLVIRGGDELSEMAGVINEMKQSLIERERLRNELEFARTIQAEMLPDEAAAGKLPACCALTGFMAPAKEVGGDLYDFFMMDDRRLGLVIADVSDKGTPAALFMATAKMCIKDNMMLGAAPKDVLYRVNNQLRETSKSGLFVTAWVGELDLDSGVLQYAAAGHPFPFLRRAESGEYLPLPSDINLVLAGKRNFVFLQEETVLHPGDRLFLYTDGLDEARDKEDGFFGKARIKEYLDAHAGDTVQKTVAGMKAAVDVFAGGREQFDDLTMLMVEYKGEQANE